MIVFCAACGTQNDGSSKFCSGCGGALTARPSVSPQGTQPPPATAASTPESVPERPVLIGPAVNQCPVCGRTYPAAQRFCHADGAALAAALPEPAAAAVAPPITTPPPLPSAQALPTPPDPAASFETRQSSEAPIPVAQVAASSAPMESPSVIDPAIPALAISAPSTSADRTTDSMQHCPTCGIVFPAGVRFCDQDGTPLAAGGVAAVEAAAQAGEAPWLAAYAPDPGDGEVDGGFASADVAPGRRYLVPTLVVAALLVLFAGGGYAFWSGAFDRWFADPPPLVLTPEAACLEVDTAAVIRPEATRVCGDARAKRAADAVANNTPGLLGRYKAYLADQDVTLAIDGNAQTIALSFTGTLTYRNAVTGESCIASLSRIGAEGITPSFAVSFRQAPVPDKPACAAEIPVTLNITGQPTDANGVVASISAEWRKPDSDEVLMKGTLQREAGQ